jgi:hypothetical protein
MNHDNAIELTAEVKEIKITSLPCLLEMSLQLCCSWVKKKLWQQ